MKPENAIEVKDVTKSFKVYLDKGRTLKELALFSKRRKSTNRVVLDGITFDVGIGEAVALIGHNGCGKSTTLKLLTKIMYPDSGTIEMRGRVSSLIELGAGFHPDMSGRENIYINASIFGLTKKEIDDRLDDIINFSELWDFIDNPVRTYSSGMYMRLAFAIAINVNADILLIDEILAVGDANFQAKCYGRMQELKRSGVTIVLVTHDMGTVKSFCSKAIWINKGKIVTQGKSSDVVDTYLAYMNNQRILAINEERRRQMELAGLPADGVKKQEETERKEPLSMDPTAKHFGNQKAVIRSCELLNHELKPVDALYPEEKFYLRFDYQINEPMDELIFGMGIFTLDGLWIFGTNTRICDVKVNTKGKTEGTVYFESNPLWLMGGEYILQCSIIEADTTPCDYYNEYMKITVVKRWNEAGIIHYDTKWYEQ